LRLLALSVFMLSAPSGGGARLLTDVDGTYPAWSPDATKVVFQSTKDGADAEIYVLELGDQRLRRLTDNESDDSQPAWSPDGSFIAFVSERDGNPEIYRMKADGSEQVRLTDHAKRDLHPRFSPDGTKILFNREAGEGRSSTAHIYEMRRDGTEVRQLSENRFPYTYPSWSPDQKTILFVQWLPPAPGAARPDTEIALLERGGAEPKRLSPAPGFDGYPSWSPDGDRIAFASDRQGGRRQIYLMGKDGSRVQQLTDSEGLQFAAPSWSPDMSSIVCVGDDGRNRRLYVVPVKAPR